MTDQTAILVYTESTPNPGTLKFVTNKMLLANSSADFPDVASAELSPLAMELFGLEYVKGVFIANNFITVTKSEDAVWHEIIPGLREFIKEYLQSDKEIVSEAFQKAKEAARKAEVEEAGDTIDDQIKGILDKYVRPAVEMDGGNIIFKSFDAGVVTLQLQGACSGCPSSTITLKAGIEGLLKRMIPEVQEVVAEEG